MQFKIHATPLHSRPFRGIGVQADAYIFDDVNRAAGVTDDDLALLERRLRALRPAVARLFVEVQWFNPSLDGCTFTWDAAGYQNLLRQLRLLQELGTDANLVMFQPMFATREQITPAVAAMVAMLERLVTQEGLRNLRWLTLWNEPDSLFPHDSPLYRRVFGEKKLQERPPWSEYVRANLEADVLLRERGLYPQIRLLVADTVWGAPIRRERLELSLAAFGAMDVAYGYHNYNPEVPSFYEGNPNYAYAGMAPEAALFRDLVGPDRELMLWEFNTCGIAGFHSHFPGVGPAGIEQVASVAGAVDVAAKVLAAAACGIDGFCLWCLHDMCYCGSTKPSVMRFGLWRYKTEQWLARPSYHYYAALMQAFRPGVRLLRSTGGGAAVHLLAGEYDGKRTVAVLNARDRAVTVTIHGASAESATRRRVYPAILPAAADLPVAVEESVTPTSDGAVSLRLEPNELTILVA